MSMKKSVKVIGLVAALVLVLGLVAVVAVLNYDDPNNPSPGIVVNGRRVREPGTIVTVAGHDISFEEYRFYFLSTKDQMQQLAASDNSADWDADEDGEKTAQLKTEVEGQLRGLYGWLDIAAENGVGLTDEEKQKLNDDIENLKTQEGEGFQQRIQDQHFASEALFRKIMEDQTLAQKISGSYADLFASQYTQYEDEILATALTAEHILIAFAEVPEDTPDKEAAQLAAEQDAETLANTLYEDIKAAQDPQKQFEEYRPIYDVDTAQPAAGYTFVEGHMVPEFYEATKALRENEISAPVRTDYGYHIILRKPLDEKELEDNREGMTFSQKTQIMNEDIQKRFNALEVVGGQYYEDITLATLR